MTDAVITGVGVVSPFGIGFGPLLDGLAEGRSAVGPIRSFDVTSFPVKFAGEVPVEKPTADWLASRLGEFDADGCRAKGWQADGALRDRKVAFGLVAAAEAWRSAGCGTAERDATLAISLGLEQAFVEDFTALFVDGAVDWKLDAAAPLPRVRYRSRVDLCSSCLVDLLDLRGPVVVHVSACASGALAVAHAAQLVERGEADIVLCGAADSLLNPMGIGGFWRLGAPSPRHAPDACRPFDLRRDGLVVGEGSAMFVIESRERARARGMRPLASVLGQGSTQDAHRTTAPRPDGSAAARAIARALDRARISPGELGYINAHGTGTPLNDPAEARAIRAVLGADADRVPVSSIKGAVGHLMAASGAIEIAASLLAFERGILPGTAHHRERDPECDIRVIGETPLPAEVDVVLSTSFGFGGQNAAVVLGRV